jgi:hypothetical protein
MGGQHRPFTYDHFRYILHSTLESDYRFISFASLDEYRRAAGRGACLLRHDCDNDLVAAAQMARIEQEFGVRSTYFLMLRSAQYNLLSISNSELVREIIGLGHWIGLHFDELYYRDVSPERLAACADRERDYISSEFNVPVEAISFHQPSRRVLDNEVRLNCLNTYDRHDMRGFHYISDSCMVWKEGCPSEFFRAQRRPLLQLLIHPEWWTEEEMSLQEKWNLMMRHNFELMQQSLLEKERAYPHRQEIIFSAKA